MKPHRQSNATSLARRFAVAAGACLALCTAVPAVASASAVWVSASTVKAPYNSCTSPGYNTVQKAVEVNAANMVIHVCSGTYAEQVVITKALTLSGEPGAKITLPASPATSTTSCAASGEQDLIDICTSSSGASVRITGLTMEAQWPAGICNDELYGINAGGGAKLTLSGSTMVGAGASPVGGCQGGVGVQIGRAHTGQVATATISQDTISGYQKNGMTIDNTGSKATIKEVTVQGAGPAPIAQNGIQVSRGATAVIKESQISGNECNTVEVPACGNGSASSLEEDAAGVLFYNEGKGSSVQTSEIAENDIGVEHLAEAESTRPLAAIRGDELVENRYAGVMLDEGFATINKDTISGGDDGVLLLQYAGQAFGPKGTGAQDTISGTSNYAVEGFSDNSPSDQFGSFKITSSAISGNPGATVAGSVFTNNPAKLPILTTASDS